MGQYVLVEKDSKVMQKCWKWLIIFLLIAISISCLLSSYFFSAITGNFNNNCVTGAKLAFKRIPLKDETLTDSAKNDAELYGKKVDELTNEFKSYYLSKELRGINGTDSAPKKQIYQFLNNNQNSIWSTTEKSNRPYLVPTVLSNDTDSFKIYQINVSGTRWGDANTCLAYYYFPIIEITVTIVWIVLIIMSRRGGERRPFTVIDKSWRLVVPAVVCFGVFAICCVIYAAFLNSRLNDFCDEFKKLFSNHELPCQFLLKRFSMYDDTIFTPETNFEMAKGIAYVRIFLWLLAGFIMLLRCILGADFEMQEIEWCTEQKGSAFDPQAEEQSQVKFIDDGIKRYSRERVYKPTTELQTLKINGYRMWLLELMNRHLKKKITDDFFSNRQY